MFDQAGGTGKPRIGQVPICWDPSRTPRSSARTTSSAGSAAAGRSTPSCPARPRSPVPRQFVRKEDVAESIPCGPDVDAHVDAVQEFVDAGFTDVAVVQIGGDTQPEFLDWAERELLPALRGSDRTGCRPPGASSPPPRPATGVTCGADRRDAHRTVAAQADHDRADRRAVRGRRSAAPSPPACATSARTSRASAGSARQRVQLRRSPTASRSPPQSAMRIAVAGHPAGLDRRLDLRLRGRAPARDRQRRARPPPVPLSR